MSFLEAMKTVVDLAEEQIGKSINSQGEHAISIINKWLAGDAPLKIEVTQKEPLTVIFHANGDMEFSGVAAKEIVIDDRR